MREREGIAGEKEKSPKININHVFLITALITVILLFSTISLAKHDWTLFMGKIADISLLWLCSGLLSIFFQTRNYKTYAKISENPIAVAIILGCLFIATALCIAG